jgi:hypothetical protein
MFAAKVHRGDGKRFVVHADEKLTAFVELKSSTRDVRRRKITHWNSAVG